MAGEQGIVGDEDDEGREQPLCGADAVLVAGGAVAEVGEGEQGAGEGTRGEDTAATTRLPSVEQGEPGQPPSTATDEATTRYRPVDAEDDLGHDPEGH